jgi:hypothetical protein
MDHYVSEQEVLERENGANRSLFFKSPQGRFEITFRAKKFYFDLGKVKEEHKVKLREFVKRNYDEEEDDPVKIDTATLRKIIGE